MKPGAASIGIVCHFPPPPGGMSGQAETLARGFAEEGFRVVRVATNFAGTRLGRTIDSIRMLRTFCRMPVFLFRLFAALFTVQNVHVMSCSHLSFFLFTSPAVLFSRLCGRRVVLHYHGGDARPFFRQWPHVVRFVAARAHVILVPSAFLREVFAELGFEAKLVPNVCDCRRFVRDGSVPPEARFIVARNLEPVYNISCILRAFRSVLDERPDASLWILGDGSERHQLERLASELNLTRAVRFFGYVDNANLPALFAQSSIFVNASLTDNQPVSILEAYAAGLPVITSPSGGIPDLVEDGRTGIFFDPHDPHELARKMLWLLHEPNLARRLAANGRERSGDFSWSTAYQVFCSIYGTASRVSQQEAAQTVHL